MSLEFTSGQLIGLLIGIVVLVVGLIYFFRSKYRGMDKNQLKEKYSNATGAEWLSSRKKYPEVNAFSLSRPFWLLGGIISLALILGAFSWTQYDDNMTIAVEDFILEEEIEQEPPRTDEPPPPPPPPPPPVIEEVPEEEIVEEEQPEFKPLEVEDEVVEEPVVEEVEDAPPPPPPPPPPKKEDEIFARAEQMPRFPGCEGKGSEAEVTKCAQEELFKWLGKNIKYPTIAKENGVTGKAYVQFVVEKDGKVTDVNVVRDPGAGLGDEALRVIKSMNDKGIRWTPGKQQGKAVRVKFTLPVNFQLQ